MTTSLLELVNLYADHLRHLLGPLWPLGNCDGVAYSDHFTKYTLGQMPDGTWAHLHHFTGPDQGTPHNHPCTITSHGIAGSYLERIFTPEGEGYRTEDVLRTAGGFHVIAPECIHKLLSLPDGECWTLCFTGPVVNEWRHFPELD
jgi:hypothetical protein